MDSSRSDETRHFPRTSHYFFNAPKYSSCRSFGPAQLGGPPRELTLASSRDKWEREHARTTTVKGTANYTRQISSGNHIKTK